MKKIIYCIILVLNISLVNGQNVIIEGSEPSYAGDSLVFYTYTDPITNLEIELGSCLVDSTGGFNFNFSLDHTSLAFIYLEIYKGFIFLEPDSTYEIKLPPKTPKVFEDIINPFFQESEFYIGVLNTSKDELNYLIKKFDNQYNTYVENNFNIIRHSASSDIDTMISKFNVEFDQYKNSFFQQYKYYKLASLRYLSYERNDNNVIRYYFLDKPILYYNPAYMELFNQLFSNFFEKYSKTKNGERIYTDVALAKSIYRIKETLGKSLALTNDTLQEIIILKSCFDEAYDNSYPFSSLKHTLDSLAYLTKIPLHKEIVKNTIKKTTYLRNGYPAPDIMLYKENNETYILSNVARKYLYLNFCTDWSYMCKEDYSLLKGIYEHHADKLEIVTIVPEADFDKVSKHFKENDYSWSLVYYKENMDAAKAFKVKAYPSYYLLNTNGKIVLSPAPSPNENFEWRFFQIIKGRG